MSENAPLKKVATKKPAIKRPRKKPTKRTAKTDQQTQAEVAGDGGNASASTFDGSATAIIAVGIFIFAAALALWLVGAGWTPGEGNSPPTIPAPSYGPNILAVLEKSPDKSQAAIHAEYLEALFARCADGIDRDGKRPKPLIATGRRQGEYRSTLRIELADGQTFTVSYPGLADLLGEYLDANAGVNPGELTADQRAKWVKSYRDIAAQCEYAAQELRK